MFGMDHKNYDNSEDEHDEVNEDYNYNDIEGNKNHFEAQLYFQWSSVLARCR